LTAITISNPKKREMARNPRPTLITRERRGHNLTEKMQLKIK
jgi:hypothetical protein